MLIVYISIDLIITPPRFLFEHSDFNSFPSIAICDHLYEYEIISSTWSSHYNCIWKVQWIYL